MTTDGNKAPVAARPARPLRPAKGKARVVRRGKRKAPARWSAKRETLFLEALANSANVASSLRAAGLAETTVYRRRRRYAEFAAKWAAALREGYMKLEGEMLSRALSGVEKPVWHGGQQVGTVSAGSTLLEANGLGRINAARATRHRGRAARQRRRRPRAG